MKIGFYDWLHDMPMGANGRRNDGSIRPAEWWRNDTKYVAVAPPQTQSHQPNTACRHWETYNTRKKHLIILHKINFCFYEKKLNFVEKIWMWLLAQQSNCDTQHNKQYTTQQTIHNTTNNTQHKIHSCYIISFETFFGRFGRFWIGGLFELD